MKLFAHAHATHPQWPMAAAMVLAQLRAQMARPDHVSQPGLGLLYITDAYAPHAQALLDHLRSELPEVTDWAGTVGVGIAANGAEYIDEPALAVMLCELPRDAYRVFSGVAPLGHSFAAHAALVHADGATPDVAELIAELAGRTDSGYLFGGLASSRGATPQFAWSRPASVGNAAATAAGEAGAQAAPAGVLHGGLSGVAFDARVALIGRVTQGCQPVAPWRTVTAAEDNVVLELDGEPALPRLLGDLDLSLERPRAAIERLRATLAGLCEPPPAGQPAQRSGRGGQFGTDVIVRHIIGLDPAREGVALAQRVAPGWQVAFCERHVQAARADLTRICTEVRAELEPEDLPLATALALAAPTAEAAPHPARRIAGAVYVSCAGRGGPHFGAPGAELQLVRRALGDVPLVGFFAGGEIARHHLYGYTGVLTVFVG